MTTPFDIQMLNLEQRSRTALARPLAAPPHTTMKEMTTDVLLKSAIDMAQTFGRLYSMDTSQRLQKIATTAKTGEEFQTLFDKDITPRLMANFILDPKGSVEMFSKSQFQGEMIDYQRQEKLNALNERLALSEITSLLSFADDYGDFSKAADIIALRAKETQGTLSEEFNMQYESILRRAEPYIENKKKKDEHIYDSTINQYIRDVRSDLAYNGSSAEAIDNGVKGFIDNVVPLLKPHRKEDATRKVIRGIVEGTSNTVAASEVLDKYSKHFTPQEKEAINKRLVSNEAIARNMKAADRQETKNIIQEYLDSGIAWEYKTNMDPEQKIYSDYLKANKHLISNKYGLGPDAYAKEAMNLPEDTPNRSLIERSLYATSSHLASKYANDFPKTVSQEPFISDEHKRVLGDLQFELPLINPETGELINAEPMTTSLAKATTAFGDIKNAYFRRDETIQQMVPADNLREYNKVFKNLSPDDQWKFLKSGLNGLINKKAGLQGFWPHRQLSSIAGGKTPTNMFTIIAGDFGDYVGYNAWTTFALLTQHPDKIDKDDPAFKTAYDKAFNDLKNVIPGIEDKLTKELVPLMIIGGEVGKAGIRSYIDDNTSYLYVVTKNRIDATSLFLMKGRVNLEGLVLPGSSSGVENALGDLISKLKKLQNPYFKSGNTYISAYDALRHGTHIEINKQKYQAVIKNIEGTFKQYRVRLQNIETGKLFDLPDEKGNRNGGLIIMENWPNAG